ncbi:MAG: DUF2326 domain-containing protein [Clostridiales bacterium]|nr:DUF2326 domain-containing protein [Clostridiales bacterium]
MLVELCSDKFISNGNVRPAISFRRGLNVVRGSDNGSNSIGKSTFLMIVDFAFGGRDYVDDTKVKGLEDEVGPHTIKFAYEFDDKRYYFSRDTENFNVIHYCDSRYEIRETKPVKDFTDFLKEKYRIALPDISFRDVVSGYLRIFHRGNDTFDKPLKAFEEDKPTSGIDRLLKLFDLYEAIAVLKKSSEEAEEAKNAYKKSQKYGQLPPTLTKTRFKENEQRLEKFREELRTLTESHDENLLRALGLDPSLTDRAFELTSRLSSLQYQRRRLREKLRELECNMGFGQYRMTQDFEALTQFFTGIDLHHLEEIEGFHNKLQSILGKQFNDAHNELVQLIALAEQEIEAVGNQIRLADLPRRTSKAFWEKCRSLEIEIHRLEAENHSQMNAEKLVADAKAAKAALSEKEKEQTHRVQTAATDKMRSLNDYVYGGVKQAPELQITGPSRYEFFTPKDGGTGTAYRGLILFDISVLSLTDLPILAHDSFLFKNIEDEALEKIMELYACEVGKQVFIAIDKVSSYTPRTQEIINTSTCLALSRGGNELFGRSWNIKDSGNATADEGV